MTMQRMLSLSLNVWQRPWNLDDAHGICILESIEASLVVCDVEEVGCLFVIHCFAQGHGGIGGPNEDRDAASHEDFAGAPR